MNSKHLLRSAVLACAIYGGASYIAYSEQIQINAPAGINPESMFGKESAQGVYVRDSAVALEKFAQAQRMERLKEWSKAADLYQEVLEKFSDRVVPSQVDKDNNIYQYTSVIAAVQQKMSKWPAEGLEVYRSRYEPSAQALLEGARADDRAAMQGILSRYFATETAKIAGLRLMDLYFESGEFSASAWLADLLLSQHPNLIVERPRVLYLRALSLHMAGEESKSKAVLDELQSKYPNETATIRGVDQKLVDSLTAELSQPAPLAMQVADTAWPMYGGSPSHSRLSTAAGRPGAKLYSIELAKPNYKGLQNEIVSQLKQRDRMDQDSGASLTVMPVIDHGDMFFQDGQRVYAISLESGQPLPGWSTTYPGDRRGQYVGSKGRTLPRGQLQTITLTDSKLLAIMGQADRFAQNFGAEGSAGEVKLVCLDRATGAEKWIAQPRTLPDEAQAIRTSEFSGSPLVIDQNVYVVARGSKGQQFEDCSVICYDLSSGKYKWHCYVASANSVANAMMMDGDGTAGPSEAIPQLAYSSGRLYVLTNLGALASIDAYGGKIVWLSIYQRDESTNRRGMNPFFGGRMMNGMNMGASGSKPWMSNPVFVDSGKIFILPSDGKYLQIYDAGTGVEVKRLDPGHLSPNRLKGEQAAEADSLIAVSGSRLLVTGPNSAMFLNWEKYNIDTFNKRSDPSIIWPYNLSESMRGRAFVANDRVFIPTLTRMFVIALKGGKAQEEYPDYNKYPKGWQPDDPEGPGNIIVSDDHVIIAANRRIDVYTNMDAARQKLDAELAANPTSPEARIKYAEVMFVSGDSDTAMAKLDEAIDLLGGRDKMTPGADRDRIYNTAINVAQKLSRDVKDANSDNLALVQQLFDRVGAAANSPIQQVNYRVLRGKLATTIKDYPAAVKYCHEIIADEEWRKVPVADEGTGAQTPANSYAKRAIDQLIRTAGVDCYKPYEEQANQQFEAAKTARQADALSRVANIYPNAKVAPQALLAAADLKESTNDYRSAVQLLRQLYLTYPTAPDKRRMLESLARNYMHIPNRSSVAIARLSEAVALGDAPLSSPLPLPGGKMIETGSLAQALTELKKARGQEVANSLPDFKLPVPHFEIVDSKRKLRPPFADEPADSVISGVQALLVPPREYQRFDRVATFTPDKGVAIYSVGSIQPLTTIPFGDSPNLMWTSTGPMLWRAGVLSQFTGDTNRAAWTFDVKSAPAGDAVAAAGADDANADVKSGEENPAGDGDVVVNGRVRIIRQGNRRLIVQNGMIREIGAPRQGKQVVVPGGGEGIIEVKLAGDSVLLTTTAGRIIALDANNGKIRWQARPAERQPDRIVANEDFVALVIREDNLVTLMVFDTFSGQTIGRRTFDDGFRVPSNMALSLDGTLVYLLPDRVVLKNLYQPWGNAEREIVDAKAAQTGQFPYVMSQQPDHLQIVDGKLLVMADQNVNLRAFSMETAKPLRYTPVDSNKEIELTFQTGNRQPNVPVSVRVVGSQVYLIAQQSLIAYNIDHPEQSWRIPTLMQKPNSGTRDEMADVFIGRNHLVLLADTKTKVNAGKVAAYRLYTYARYGQDENDPAESGITTFIHLQGDPSGITAWQPVDGGFYYLAADQKLHFLKGAAK